MDKMAGVEVSREEDGPATVFEAMTARDSPVRASVLLYAVLLEASFVGAAELTAEPTATMLRWLAVMGAIPLILLWAVVLVRLVGRGAVRLTVTPEGLQAYGHLYPHRAIRDLALYAPGSARPLFVTRIGPVTSRQHLEELELAGGMVDPEALSGGKGKGPRKKRGFRLVMHRRNRLPSIVLVHGLTLAGGETLLAGLAAELRKHSPPAS